MVQTYVRIKMKALRGVIDGFERRKAQEPGFKWKIPDDETIIEFNGSCMSSGPDEKGTKNYDDKPFGCYDDVTNILTIQ